MLAVSMMQGNSVSTPVYLRQCAFWTPARARTKGTAKHTFQTGNLWQEYCCRAHQRLAINHRWRGKLHLDHLYEPQRRRQAKQEPPILGATKYSDEEMGRTTSRNLPEANTCVRCGTFTSGEDECWNCARAWF